jgi:endonuclease/exonuclease/phosphatase family metal-dependent hydrolase
MKQLLYFLLLIFISATSFYFWGGAKAYPEWERNKYVRFKSQSKKARDTISIITYNIGYLSGMTNNLAVNREKRMYDKHLDYTIQTFKNINPDIVAFQEIDFASERSFFVNQFEEIANAQPFFNGAYAINWDKNYVPFPYSVPSQHFGKILSGQAVLSQFPILEEKRTVLKSPLNSNILYDQFYLNRLAQIVKIKLRKEFYLVNVHLEAFDKETREEQAYELVKLIKSLDLPVILLGDFNTIPLLAKNKKPTGGDPNRFLEEKTLITLKNSLGFKSLFPDEYFTGDESSSLTFPSAKPVEKLDYIFYDPNAFEVIEYKTLFELGTVSDHLPVFARFVMK